MATDLQPVIFLSHGGGPSFFLSAKEHPHMKGMDKDSRAAEYLRNMVRTEKLPRPTAILVISAHWEESAPTVMTGLSPPLYYDYSNFPPETYKFQWAAPGAPDVARRTKDILEKKGITCLEDNQRGFDHGVFVPLLLAFPKADIPVFQVSLMSHLDMERHLDLGEALADLRKEGVLIIGSGFTTHGVFSHTTGIPATWTLEFQRWLHDILQNPDYSREDKRGRLMGHRNKAEFRKAHPRIEHFLPIAVTLAAAGYSAPKVAFSEFLSPDDIFEHYVYVN